MTFFDASQKKEPIEKLLPRKNQELYAKIFQKKNPSNNNSSNAMDHEIVRGSFFSSKVIHTYDTCTCTNALNLY